MFARQTDNTAGQAAAGRIDVDDVDELQQILQPWDVVLRQMSSGKLHARMDYVQINGIVLYREHWSHRILGTGVTPPGFFFIGGRTSSQSRACWCGIELGADRLAFARSSSKIDFATHEAETHVCLLVPDDLMRRYLGDEFLARGLPTEPFLACANGGGAVLLRLMERILDNYSVHRDLLANERTRRAIEWRLMGGLVEFLLTRRERGTDVRTPRAVRYHRLVRRAIDLCDASIEPVSVSDLAETCCVSKRVLELAFQAMVRVTPCRFLKQNRMNRVRKELRATNRATDNVTEILSRWGVSEFGRFAVEYKRHFGESPSTTLGRDAVVPARRLADVLESPCTLEPEHFPSAEYPHPNDFSPGCADAFAENA
jgi:AraC family ethanolamine operon transcriptional activator